MTQTWRSIYASGGQSVEQYRINTDERDAERAQRLDGLMRVRQDVSDAKTADEKMLARMLKEIG